jgi:sugar/nucleoside kinase (ribokinase family)
MYGLDRNKPYDVIAIGNAILDVLAFTEEALLERFDIKKGSMTLISAEEAERLYSHMNQCREVSGGSAANTLAGMAQLGARTAFIGKVADDQFGKIYRHDMHAVGVDFDTPVATTGKPTGCCYIMVTPDAQRTMNTYLGAGSDILSEEIDETLVSKTKILYVEGYQWSSPENQAMVRHAYDLAERQGAKIAFTLSDVFCVEGHRGSFQAMIANHIDILFANEAEARALYPEKEWEAILTTLQGACDVVAITRGEKGSVILTKNERIEVPAKTAPNVVDTTGAGDLYAAGFLYGYVHAMPLKECGRLGSACATEIIQQLGARALKPLKDVLAA